MDDRREAGEPLRDLELFAAVIGMIGTTQINSHSHPDLDLDLLDAFDWTDFERLPDRERDLDGVLELLRLLPLRLRDLDAREPCPDAREAGLEASEAICRFGEFDRLPDPERELACELALRERLLRGEPPSWSICSVSGKTKRLVRGLKSSY